jgi:alkylhydroperoxidase family enzyme
MSGREASSDRLQRLRDDARRVVDAVLDGEGATSAQARHAAFAGHADDPAVARYLDLVRRHAYRVTEEDVEGLRGAGLDEDAIFELTVAAATGAGAKRLKAGLSLLGREA